MLTRPQLPISNWTSGKLSVLSGLAVCLSRKERLLQNSFYSLIEKYGSKRCLVQRNQVALWPIKRALFQWKLRNKELKTSGWSWKCEMLSCIWKKLQLFTACRPVATACSKITRTSVKVGKTRRHLLVLLQVQERISEKTFSRSLVGRALKRTCWGALCWDDRRSPLSKWTLLHCM